MSGPGGRETLLPALLSIAACIAGVVVVVIATAVIVARLWGAL